MKLGEEMYLNIIIAVFVMSILGLAITAGVMGR